jgi:hypothetical protein
MGISYWGRRSDALRRSRQDSYLSYAEDSKAIPRESRSFSADFQTFPELPHTPPGMAEYAIGD